MGQLTETHMPKTEERTTTLYILDSKKRTRFWRCTVDNDTVITERGIVDGAATRSADKKKAKNIGKTNETSPQQQAIIEADAKIKLQKRRGYSEEIPTEEDPDTKAEFFNSPPRSTVFAKPKYTITQAAEDAMDDPIYTRKRNGHCVFVFRGGRGNIKILSASLDDKTGRFPGLEAQLKKLMKKKSVIAAELTFGDDPDLAKSVLGADTENAIGKQNEMVLPAVLRPFNVLYLNGKKCTVPYRERLEALHEVFKDSLNIKPVEILKTADCKKVSGKRKILVDNPEWEGLVLWDGKSARIPVKWSGSPSRACGAFKIKEFKEADVVVVKWDSGKGRLTGKPGRMHFAAYKDGELIEMGNGGTGLNDVMREEILEMDLPFVVEITYEKVTKDGKFLLPSIQRIRTDKKATDCLHEDIKL